MRGGLASSRTLEANGGQERVDGLLGFSLALFFGRLLASVLRPELHTTLHRSSLHVHQLGLMHVAGLTELLSHLAELLIVETEHRVIHIRVLHVLRLLLLLIEEEQVLRRQINAGVHGV